MKVTVRITGILEAELELPETTTSAMGVRDYATWHGNQYTCAMQFIDRCAQRACDVTKAQRSEPQPTEP